MPPICMPSAGGIPGAPGPPNWEQPVGPGLAASLNQRLDDPRWQGAGGSGWGAPDIGPGEPSPLGNATGLPAVFRALSSGAPGARSLYLLWWVRADTSHDASDQLIVGFEAANGTAFSFLISPFTSSPPAPGAIPLQVPLGRMSAFQRVAGVWGARPGGVPTWLSSVWAWATAGQEWAVAMRVPLIAAGDLTNAGINLASPFRFWWELQVTSGATIVYGPRWPFNAPDFATNGPGDPAMNWDDAHIGADPSCAGVSVEWSDIGSANPGGAHQVDINAPNLLHVDPGNTGAAVPANRILARFRIANWGSSTNWLAIVPDGAATPEVPDTGGIGAGAIGTPVHGHIQFPWTVPPALRAAFVDGTRDRHQCMLVELSGANVTFVRDSAFRNMQFVGASTFTDEAEVSVEGLVPIGGGKRRTYLMLSLTNMPEFVEPRRPEEPDRTDPDGPVVAVEKDGAGDPDAAFRFEPTYVVQVFHDTGRRREIGGRQLRVVEPAPNYGYVVDHQGALHGWDAAVSGSALTRLAENLWEATIADGGHIKVRTRIVARERALTWWERLLRWLLAILRRLWWKLLRRLRR